MKVVGYVRVSTDEQVREGVSLEAQKSKISSWANALDYEVICIEEDAGISGKNIRAREGLQRALNLACAEKAILVVHSLSRLSRSTRDTLAVAERLDKAGADLVSLSERIDTTNAAGKMIFRMLAVLNEFERDQISERTSAILQHKKSKLEVYSSTPYGYIKDGKKLVADPQEQRVISKIYSLHKQGVSFRKIVGYLNRHRIPSKKGREWHSSTVYYILNNSIHTT
ncbi:MAG: recombinase family protein [Candidatus Sabulitectum sp.]|nr:recombinase family protein [Candidatus Sabulitectum sp.]